MSASHYLQYAVDALERAGHRVVAADRVPGLYDVGTVARDVTEGQLWQLAQVHGAWNHRPDAWAGNAFATNAFGLPPT
jgi:hypothetical protein